MASPCIPCSTVLRADGYGSASYKGRNVLAHRLAYAAHHGLDVLTMGGVVMHSCDNRACINVEHLSLGTQLNNIADMVSKGRQSRLKGEANPQVVLTESIVLECRRRYKPYCPVNGGSALAREYQVSQPVMAKAITGVSWSHLPLIVAE